MTERPDRELKKAADPFRNHLTIEEASAAPAIKYDLSKGIYWGSLADNCLRILMSVLEGGVSNAKHCPEWVRASLRAGLTSSEIRYFSHATRGPLRREYVFLLLMQKLLGAMKTKVNQRLEKIQPMSGLAENNLFQQIEDRLGKGTLDDDTMLEAIDAVLNDRMPTVSSPFEKITCRHHRRLLRYQTVGRCTWRVETCQDCGTITEEGAGRWLGDLHAEDTQTTSVSNVLPFYRGEPKPKVHKHTAQWKEGLEGKEAFCPSCKEDLPDPETYFWADAGLEPYGDDPSKDELIVLKAEEA